MEGSDEEYQDQDTQANANDNIDVDDDNDDNNSSAIHFPATHYCQEEEDLTAPSVDGNYLYLLLLHVFIRCELYF